jgi:hypothetical protein
MPVFRATIGPKAEAAALGQHDAFIHGELTFRAATTEDAQTTLRYLTNFMSPGNLWFRVEEVPEAEAHGPEVPLGGTEPGTLG